MIKAENSTTPSALKEAIGQLIEWSRQETPEHRKLRRAFTVWLGRSLLPARFPGVVLPELHNLLEAKNMLSERVVEWTKEWEQQGMEQGMKKGIKKGLEKGLKQGMEQGLEQGLEKGIDQARAEMAKNMLAEGTDIAFISRVTELTAAQVKALNEP